MSPHSEAEGGGEGYNRDLSISEGGMMAFLPLALPSSFLHPKQICINPTAPIISEIFMSSSYHFMLEMKVPRLC